MERKKWTGAASSGFCLRHLLSGSLLPVIGFCIRESFAEAAAEVSLPPRSETKGKVVANAVHIPRLTVPEPL
jgi:hypothetical protein